MVYIPFEGHIMATSEPIPESLPYDDDAYDACNRALEQLEECIIEWAERCVRTGISEKVVIPYEHTRTLLTFVRLFDVITEEEKVLERDFSSRPFIDFHYGSRTHLMLTNEIANNRAANTAGATIKKLVDEYTTGDIVNYANGFIQTAKKELYIMRAHYIGFRDKYRHLEWILRTRRYNVKYWERYLERLSGVVGAAKGPPVGHSQLHRDHIRYTKSPRYIATCLERRRQFRAAIACLNDVCQMLCMSVKDPWVKDWGLRTDTLIRCIINDTGKGNLNKFCLTSLSLDLQLRAEKLANMVRSTIIKINYVTHAINTIVNATNTKLLTMASARKIQRAWLRHAYDPNTRVGNHRMMRTIAEMQLEVEKL